MSKTAAIPMDKEIQSFQLIFIGQQYFLMVNRAVNLQAFQRKMLPHGV